MSYEHERRVFAVLDEVLDAGPAARSAVLDRLCGDDAALRAEVEALVEREPGGLLAAPAFDVHGNGAETEGGVGRTIGDYRLVEVLGRGGMGTVYRAERRSFEQIVALKIIRRGLDLDPILVQRFENERQVLARLEHPGIARLLDGGSTAEGLPYVAMELVDGVPLDVYCRDHGLGLRARLELFLKILDAVGFAHRNLIVHRDLKPGNILVDATGQPKLLDFGIAKVLDDGVAASPLHTATGESPMTPRYASPEQIRRQPITTAADVYVLGVLLFELVTGVPAYATDDPAEIPQWVCERETERPSTAVRRRDGGLPGLAPESLRRRLAGDLDAIISKALRKAPAERYGSVEALAGDLRRHLDGLPVLARRGDARYRAAKFIQRNRLAVAVASLVLLTIVGASVAVAYYALRFEKQTERNARLAIFLREMTPTLGNSRAAKRATEAALIAEQRLVDAGELDAKEMGDRADFAGRLGRMLHSLGDFEHALLATEAAHRWAERAYGRGHLETFKHLNNRAAVLVDLGLEGEAIEFFRQGVSDMEGAGVDEKETFRTRSNLGTILKNRGDFEEADRYLQDVLDRRKALYSEEHGADDKDVATSRHNLAASKYAGGDFEEALSLAEQALGSRERKEGERHRKTVNTQVLVGQILMAMGSNDEATARLEAALEARIADRGLYDVKTAIAQRHLAEALLGVDPGRAGMLLRSAIETFKREPEVWRIAEAQNLLASFGSADAATVEKAKLWADRVAEVRGEDSTPARRAYQRVEEMERRLEAEKEAATPP